jgi:hypothetical protein
VDHHVQGHHRCASLEFLTQPTHLLRAPALRGRGQISATAQWSVLQPPHEPIGILLRAPKLPPPPQLSLNLNKRASP